MANETKVAETPGLDDLAFKIYTQAVAARPLKGSGEREAMDAYRKAEAFLAVQKRVASGQLKAARSPADQLAECSAPNLDRKRHPLNIVSKRFGNAETLRTAAKIHEWLKANPVETSDPKVLVEAFNEEFVGFNWDLPTINVARAVFPAYVGAAAKS